MTRELLSHDSDRNAGASSSQDHLHGNDDAYLNEHLDALVDAVPALSKGNPTSRLSEPAPHQPLAPLVLVEGFLSFIPELLWGKFEAHLNARRASLGLKDLRRVIFSRVGPVSSLHDRACELYYSLKGGTVDYGEAHAREHKHLQYGRVYKTGQYPSWSRTDPLHMVTHSMGGPTVQTLQQLIRSGHFGPDAHPDMIVSVTSVAAPFRGSPVVFLFGESKTAAPEVNLVSAASVIIRSIHILTYIYPFLPSFVRKFVPDLFVDPRPMTFYDISFKRFLKEVYQSPWGHGLDVISMDCTFEGSKIRETAGLELGPKTWYRSYATCMTHLRNKQGNGPKHHVPHLRRFGVRDFFETLVMWAVAFIMGTYNYSSIRPIPFFLQSDPKPISRREDERANRVLRQLPESEKQQAVPSRALSTTSKGSDLIRRQDSLGEEYYANDGIVPVFSQWHPGECSEARCIHHSTLSDPSTHAGKSVPSNPRDLQPSIWNVYHVPETTHVSLMPIWLGTKRQAEFWVELGEWLEGVDAGRRLLDAEDGVRASTLKFAKGMDSKSIPNGSTNGGIYV